jgi:hypothetical protein
MGVLASSWLRRALTGDLACSRAVRWKDGLDSVESGLSTVRDLPGEGSYVVNPLGDDGSASVLFAGEVVAVIEPGT